MLEAHYTTDTKIQPIKSFVAAPPATIKTHKLFSDKEADKKLCEINNDIYEGTKKEKKQNGFNKSLFLKIFGILGLAVAGITCFSKIRKFFRK